MITFSGWEPSETPPSPEPRYEPKLYTIWEHDGDHTVIEGNRQPSHADGTPIYPGAILRFIFLAGSPHEAFLVLDKWLEMKTHWEGKVDDVSESLA
jgi:hypothetical protein